MVSVTLSAARAIEVGDDVTNPLDGVVEQVTDVFPDGTVYTNRFNIILVDASGLEVGDPYVIGGVSYTVTEVTKTTISGVDRVSSFKLSDDAETPTITSINVVTAGDESGAAADAGGTSEARAGRSRCRSPPETPTWSATCGSDPPAATGATDTAWRSASR